MKKIIISIFLSAIFFSCSTVTKSTSFGDGTELKDNVLINPNIKFEVIGNISVNLIGQVSGEFKGGIREYLLKKAKEKYPNADDVIDISISYIENTTTVSSFRGKDSRSEYGKIYEARVITYIK